MVRTEIHGVNAGMAGILLLVLLFFALTVLTPNETIKLRSFLESAEVPFDFRNVIFCELRPQFDILVNRRNQVLVRDQLTTIENVPKLLEMYYNRNRESGNKYSDYPSYQRNSSEDYAKELPTILNEIADLKKSNSSIAKEILLIKEGHYLTAIWKIEAINLYQAITGKKSVAEINRGSCVKIEFTYDASYKTLTTFYDMVYSALSLFCIVL
jgi:hypothetical protein